MNDWRFQEDVPPPFEMHRMSYIRRKAVPQSPPQTHDAFSPSEHRQSSISTISRPELASDQYGSDWPLSPILSSPKETATPRECPHLTNTYSYSSVLSRDSGYTTETQGSGARLLEPYEHADETKFLTPLTSEVLKPPSSSARIRATSWWNPVWTMYALFFVGMAGAILHHAFYASLAGKEAKDQLHMIRFGSALSYLTKVALVASVAIAYRQQIWATFRRKEFSVAAIDGLFAAMEEPGAIISSETVLNAKVAMFLAVLMWVMPLAVILVPATLTVEPSVFINQTTCSSVRTLNFTTEETNDWRKPKMFRGLYELSLSFWNTTSTNTSDPDFFDYYTAASGPLIQVSTLTAYFQQIVPRQNVASDTCGPGWNCSYTISFTAPGYQCSQHLLESLDDLNAPFNQSLLAPQGNYSYFAITDLGDYAAQQVDSGVAGIPLNKPFPHNLGVFRTEPVLWVGHAILKNNATYPANTTDPNWSSAWAPQIFSCEHYETNYTVQFNYTSGGDQIANVINRTFLNPIINTTFVPGVNANDGTKDNTTAIPETNYIYPQDVERYRLTAAYHSIGAQLRSFINGTIYIEDGVPITETEATKTRLIDPHYYLPGPNLINDVQSFYEDIVLSLFSNPQFLVVSWAGNPSILSGTGAANGTYGSYPCTKSRALNRFVYHARDLWLVYSLILFLAAVSITFGAAAISQNAGQLRDTRFSNVVAATRGPGIQRLGWQSKRRGDVSRTKLRYGRLNRACEERTDIKEDMVGFGLEGELEYGMGAEGKRGSVLSFQKWNSR